MSKSCCVLGFEFANSSAAGFSRNFLLVFALALLLSGCSGEKKGLEYVYGSGLSAPAKFCLGESGGSDPVFYECIVGIAIGVGNSSICEEVFTESPAYEMRLKHDSCLFRVGEANREPDRCQRIANSTMREWCYAYSGRYPEACLPFGEGDACILEGKPVSLSLKESGIGFSCRILERSDCLLVVGSNTKNTSACEMISSVCNPTSDAACRVDFDECFVKVAKKSGDANICRSLGIPFNGKGLPGYSPENAMTNCNIAAFNSSEGLSECLDLSGKARAECIAGYAVLVGSPDVCDGIGEELRGVVSFPLHYEEYVRPHSDWSIFSLGKVHDECLTNIAMQLENPAVCEREFLVSNGNSLCFFELAVSLNDSSLCRRINGDSARESCIAQLGAG